VGNIHWRHQAYLSADAWAVIVSGSFSLFGTISVYLEYSSCRKFKITPGVARGGYLGAWGSWSGLGQREGTQHLKSTINWNCWSGSKGGLQK